MIDTDKIDNMKQWTNDYKVKMFWDLVAEVKRLRELKIAEEDELEKLCNRAIFYEDEYNLSKREKQELLEEVKRLRDGIQYWFDTIAHREDDVMVQYFKRLIE